MNYLTAILTVLLTTNEVHLGTATINNESYKVIGLQVVTNRIIRTVQFSGSGEVTAGATMSTGESWTNTIPGPIVATNLVKAPAFSTNVTAQWLNVKDLVITNYLGTPFYWRDN